MIATLLFLQNLQEQLVTVQSNVAFSSVAPPREFRTATKPAA